MKMVTVTYRIPTGYIGVDIEEDDYFIFEDDATEEEMNAEIESAFTDWVENMLEDMRMSAEYDIEVDEEDEV